MPRGGRINYRAARRFFEKFYPNPAGIEEPPCMYLDEGSRDRQIEARRSCNVGCRLHFSIPTLRIRGEKLCPEKDVTKIPHFN